MNPNDNYVQNYYEDDYYEDQLQNFQDTCGDFSNLQVPNARLYPQVKTMFCLFLSTTGAVSGS